MQACALSTKPPNPGSSGRAARKHWASLPDWGLGGGLWPVFKLSLGAEGEGRAGRAPCEGMSGGISVERMGDNLSSSSLVGGSQLK